MTTDPGVSVVQVLTQQLEHAEPDLLRHKTWPSSSSPCGAAGDRAKTPQRLALPVGHDQWGSSSVHNQSLPA